MQNYVDQSECTNVEEGDSNNLLLSELPKAVINKIEMHGFDLICISDASGKIDFISDSVKKMLGFTKQQLTGKSVFRYIRRDDQKYIRNYFAVNSEEEQKIYIHIRNHIGRYIIFETIVQFIYWNGNKKILALSKDISDKKQAEEMLIRSEKMSIAGQLAAGIAHEIRNPLTSLKGFVQLLQGGIESKEEYYNIMIDEINKINTITSELLFISKPMTDDKNNEQIHELLQDVITLLRTQANLYDIDLILEVIEEITIPCDRSQIKQVFINLIKNAIEEMTEGGKIHVKVNCINEECVIAIKDEGSGIPKHLIHKLKEPFFTTKKMVQG
ncbi:sporulation kinase A [Gracilibacillus boraciitolerans JCM 21714]|uniref:histidine kinase n=1 Tax=Gracilibacillus boraciitolerans JCM 21714 TaxID=1298598 RepID=W4VDP0_9BACI|nr:PAS domain S-box protein [Gracilibacillus boraciitolerans]GAE91510.1 sporulation kinase A [Gracilibacillus boraciitolerans JCM 21714]